MRNMELWKLMIKFRNEHTGKKLTIMEKEIFYQDAQKVLEKAIYLLEKNSIPVTSTIQIAQVAAINSDYSIALTIAEAFDKVGPIGLKMIVEGNQFNDELDVISGIQLNNVTINPMFLLKCSGIEVFNNCSLILYGDKVDSLSEIKDLIDMVESKNKKAIYIFSACDRKTLHDMVQLKLKEKRDIVVAELLKPGINSSTSLQDISVLTGTKIIGKNFKEIPLEIITGHVETAYVTEDEVLLLGIDLTEDNIEAYIPGLLGQYLPDDLPSLQSRIYTLQNNQIALIKIGGVNEEDVRKRMGMAVDTLGRAEQAVNHGLIVGAGRCLLDIIQQVSQSVLFTQQINGGTIVVDAMQFFYDLMYSDSETYYDLSREKSVLVPRFFGYDKKTKQYVNLIAEGILDPKSYFAQSLMFAKLKCIQYTKELGRDLEDDSL